MGTRSDRNLRSVRSVRSVRAPAAVLTAAALLAAGSCATAGDGDSDDGGTSGASPVRVYAAASLSTVGDELAAAFADEHGGTDVEYTFAGSPALVRQIGQGADAEVFISADGETMDTALSLARFRGAEPRVVATNRLVLATAPGNPLGITSPEDLGTLTDGRLAVCAEGVPCGTLAHRYLGDLDVPPATWTVTEEANVSDVATKVATGEVDAGFVYTTDARVLQDNASDGTVQVMDLGDRVGLNTYPAALTAEGQDDPAARDFLDWLTTDTAREILGDHGFGTE
ncbi:molybdate ABC transporter substrate-binding protein [Corynebacteriaceae bacterium 7-707]